MSVIYNKNFAVEKSSLTVLNMLYNIEEAVIHNTNFQFYIISGIIKLYNLAESVGDNKNDNEPLIFFLVKRGYSR